MKSGSCHVVIFFMDPQQIRTETLIHQGYRHSISQIRDDARQEAFDLSYSQTLLSSLLQSSHTAIEAVFRHVDQPEHRPLHSTSEKLQELKNQLLDSRH
jgi:hypothetical protein